LTLAAVVAFGSIGSNAQTGPPPTCLKSFGQAEWATLIRGIDEEAKKQFFESEAFRESQRENIRNLLAFACEAYARGLHREKTNAAELDYIRIETVAVEYDKKTSKSATPFSSIVAADVEQFYREPRNLADFERFLENKLELLRRGGATDTDSVSAEEKRLAKSLYAKLRISEKMSVTSRAKLGAAFRFETQLKVRLQQSQFLLRQVMDEMVREFAATDAEVTAFLAKHPELSTAAKRSRAQGILDRAKSGEDFAKLANEFTEDPGNAGSNGEKHGGLYADVPVGRMVASFEKASLSLEQGQIHPTLVESDFGFHVIKLEKKTSGEPGTYDVRHILISTGYRDPNDPDGRDIPVGTWVRTQVENGKEGAVIANLLRKHSIAVAKFRVPQKTPAKVPVRRRGRSR
jgi:hypothetical protein